MHLNLDHFNRLGEPLDLRLSFLVLGTKLEEAALQFTGDCLVFSRAAYSACERVFEKLVFSSNFLLEQLDSSFLLLLGFLYAPVRRRLCHASDVSLCHGLLVGGEHACRGVHGEERSLRRCKSHRRWHHLRQYERHISCSWRRHARLHEVDGSETLILAGAALMFLGRVGALLARHLCFGAVHSGTMVLLHHVHMWGRSRHNWH